MTDNKQKKDTKPALSLPKMKPIAFFGSGNMKIQKSNPKPPVIRRTGHKG